MSSLFHLSAKEINSCLHFIADRRVQGAEWEEIAQDLERPLQEVRRFVYLHEEVFRLQMKKARQEQKQHCYDTAFEVLRQQTASKNEKISHSAACTLLRLKLSEDRLRLKKLQQKMRAQASENKKALVSPPPPQNPPCPADGPPQQPAKNQEMPVPAQPVANGLNVEKAQAVKVVTEKEPMVRA